jgi:hypothetical protein
MIFILNRNMSCGNGTFGNITENGKILCYTCEPMWNENKSCISCIPCGTYSCVKHNGSEFKDVWELKNVPGREGILIHNGNLPKDTHGCILVGDNVALFGNKHGVTNSRKTLDMLRKTLPDVFSLEITSLY